MWKENIRQDMEGTPRKTKGICHGRYRRRTTVKEK